MKVLTKTTTNLSLRFVAFPATEYGKVFSGYQPGQMVERCKNQRFVEHLCPRPQGTSLVNQTLVFSPLNHLARLIARENVIVNLSLVSIYTIRDWNWISPVTATKLLDDSEFQVTGEYLSN
jgi:hypothetical protein